MEVSGQLHTTADLPPGKNPGAKRIAGWVGRTAGLGFWRREQALKV